MSWLKSARGLKGISQRELAESIGKSQIYLKKIEAGDRDLPQELAEQIYDVLGFSPQDVPFDTSHLLLDLDECGDTVYLDYVLVDGRIYFTKVQDAPTENSVAASNHLARLLLQSQLVLFG